MNATEWEEKTVRQPILRVSGRFNHGVETLFDLDTYHVILGATVPGNGADLPAVRAIRKDGSEVLYVLGPGDMVTMDPLPGVKP